MEISDLIVLYSLNGVTAGTMRAEKAQEKNPDLKIDLKNRTWSYKKIQNISIGEFVPQGARRPYENGPLAIYDSTESEQTKKIVEDALNFTRQKKEEYEPESLED